MSEDKNSHIEIAYSSIRCFADDGTLDMKELNSLLGIALRDGTVTDDEKRVLGNVFKEVERDHVTDDVWGKIQETRAKYGI
jgi:hypothetical protein